MANTRMSLFHSRHLQWYLKIRYIHGALRSGYAAMRNARQCNNSEDNLFWITVEPCLTTTPLIRSSRYCGYLFFARQNSHRLAYKKTLLNRAPIDTVNGHFFKFPNSYDALKFLPVNTATWENQDLWRFSFNDLSSTNETAVFSTFIILHW